jgi:ABC-type sugar transport system ATPase subunit
LIFDEPTAALSDAEIARVLRIIKNLAAEGKSVVYVTHRLREVFEIADRVTIFRNGLSEPAADVAGLDVDQIITRMLGRELGGMYPPHQDGSADGGLVVEGLTTPGVETPIDLKIGRGQILGLTGQLGSGASFTLQAIAGVMPVLAGSVFIDGKKLNLKSRRAGIKAGVAYCSADRKKDGIFVGLSMERNLSSPWLDRVSHYGMVSRRQENIAAAEIGEQFMIDQGRLRSSVGTLSGGNQQKVAVGKWLGVKPSVLLVNEPTRGVDVGARAEIYRQLRTLCDEGLIVVVCSSDTNEIFGLCDVIGSFYRGQLSALRPYSEWTEAKLVSEVMRGSVEAA